VFPFLGHLETVQWLCQHGADVTAVTNFGQTALHFAALNGHDQAAKTLTDAGVPMDHADTHGERAVYVASLKGQVGVVSLLAGRGADLRSPDKAGVTPLWLSLRHAQVRIAFCLLSNGAFQMPGALTCLVSGAAALGLAVLSLAAMNAGGLHLLPDLILEVAHYVFLVLFESPSSPLASFLGDGLDQSGSPPRTTATAAQAETPGGSGGSGMGIA